MMLRELQKHQWERNAVLWAIGLSAIIIIFTGILTRITLNIEGSVINNPDLAIVVILEDEGVKDTILLRDEGSKRHYLVETKEGNKLVILEKTDEWRVLETENLHE